MNENAIVEGIVLALVIGGTIITLIASIGVIRFPDVYTRAHATTKSTTLGILCILLGAFVYFFFTHNLISVRLLLGIVFVFLTAPVAGHFIIRSAHRSGVPLAKISVRDDLADDLEQWKREAARAQASAEPAEETGKAPGGAGGEPDPQPEPKGKNNENGKQ